MPTAWQVVGPEDVAPAYAWPEVIERGPPQRLRLRVSNAPPVAVEAIDGVIVVGADVVTPPAYDVADEDDGGTG